MVDDDIDLFISALDKQFEDWDKLALQDSKKIHASIQPNYQLSQASDSTISKIKEELEFLALIIDSGHPDNNFNDIDLTPLTDSDKRRLVSIIESAISMPIHKRKEIASADYWFQIGRIIQKLGDVKNAENCYRLAILCKRDFSPAWYSLAEVLKEKKEKEKCYRNIIDMNPDDAVAWYNLGNTLNDIKEQEKCYKKSVLLDPNFQNAWINLAAILKDPKKQEKCYLKALEINPVDADAWYNLGTVLEAKSDQHRCFKKAVELNPHDADAWYNLAITATSLEEKQKFLKKAHELGFKR